MAIQDFIGQQQQALRTGIGLGEAMRFNPLREQAMQLQNELQGMQVEQMPVATQRMQLQNAEDMNKYRAQVAASLIAADPELQDSLIPDFVNQLTEMGDEVGVRFLTEIQGMEGKDRLVNLFGAMNALQGKDQKAYQKGESGLVFNPNTGKLSVDPIYAENVKQLNELEVERKRQLNELSLELAKAKERTKGLAEREKKSIDDGLSAAQGMPTLKRADKLLDMVETGKIENVQRMAGKWFGIDDADAAELDNLLGKRVLQQLKPIFGAQFTVQEGQWLKDMESSFGTGTEANRRLIRQGLDLLKKKAEFGIEAADAAADQRIKDNIIEWMNFSYSDDPNDDPINQTVAPQGTKVGRFQVEYEN